ncbi:hypothetical protein SRIMM317S_03069 [Streptomyces rimosus subsp. rimosus]
MLLAPTGLFLMWQNPSWSTMHIADGHRGVWAGLPLLYAGGVVTATLLGFLLAQALCLVGAGYWAYLNCVAGHFLLFGTLVHGWDGQGYRRFLSTDGAALRAWSEDSVINCVLRFLTSGTFLHPPGPRRRRHRHAVADRDRLAGRGLAPTGPRTAT